MIADPLIKLGIAVLAGLSAHDVSAAVLSARRRSRRDARRFPRSAEQSGSSITRLLAERMPAFLMTFARRAWGDRFETQLLEAGRQDATVDDVIAESLLMAALGPLVGFAWLGVSAVGATGGIFAGALFSLLPGRRLASEARERRRVFVRLLPEFTELAAIGVEAGLSMDRSIDLYCRHFRNPVSETFSAILDEIALGKPRRAALEESARANKVDSLTALVSAILRAEKLGAAPAAVLREQARHARERHYELTRELSATASVKMLGPIAGMILPALLIVIMGPAVLHFL